VRTLFSRCALGFIVCKQKRDDKYTGTSYICIKGIVKVHAARSVKMQCEARVLAWYGCAAPENASLAMSTASQNASVARSTASVD